VSKASLESVGDGHFRVTGVLDAATTPLLLEESSQRFPDGNGADIRIDLGGVSESDSAGLALLLEWLRLAKGRSQVVHFANVPAQLAALARISEVEALILPDANNERKRA
jgi:phospholipid transport system transporter-binding protein